MQYNLTSLFREDAVHYDINDGPSMVNPGGGLSTKKHYLQLALPNMVFVSAPSKLENISIVDPLYFSGGNTDADRDERIESYRKHDGFTILWTSDFELLRWQPIHREQILDATDVIAGNSHFMFNLLTALFPNQTVVHLTDTIDTNVTQGNVDREKAIYACSQIVLEKGIDNVVSLFKRLAVGTNAERELKRHFIGSSSTWGCEIRDQDSFDLETQIEEVCQHHWSMSNVDVRAFSREAWHFVSFTKFETFGYAMVEAMLGGCQIWAVPHLAYEDRIQAGVVTSVEHALDAQSKISDFIQNNEPKRNDAAIQFVHDNYSLDVFRKQFKNIVGGIYGI